MKLVWFQFDLFYLLYTMKLLQLLSLPREDVRREMWYKSPATYHKKFYSLTSVGYKEYYQKIRPFALKHLQKIWREITFLDLYFATDDKLKAMGGGNQVSTAGKRGTNVRSWNKNARRRLPSINKPELEDVVITRDTGETFAVENIKQMRI